MQKLNSLIRVEPPLHLHMHTCADSFSFYLFLGLLQRAEKPVIDAIVSYFLWADSCWSYTKSHTQADGLTWAQWVVEYYKLKIVCKKLRCHPHILSRMAPKSTVRPIQLKSCTQTPEMSSIGTISHSWTIKLLVLQVYMHATPPKMSPI